MARHSTCLIALFLLCTAAPPCAAQGLDERFEMRSTYLDARKALREGRTTTFARLQAQLTRYPLHPYLEYYQLRSQLSSASVSAMTGFLQDHTDSV